MKSIKKMVPFLLGFLSATMIGFVWQAMRAERADFPDIAFYISRFDDLQRRKLLVSSPSPEGVFVSGNKSDGYTIFILHPDGSFAMADVMHIGEWRINSERRVELDWKRDGEEGAFDDFGPLELGRVVNDQGDYVSSFWRVDAGRTISEPEPDLEASPFR